jgi:nucleotide-binding universal stress UspA family protein
MTTILAAIDDSAAAQPVLGTALALAPILDATVEAVHVSAGQRGGRTAQATALAANVAIRRVVGDPLEQIHQMADEDDVVALVVGARARLHARRRAGHLALALADAIVKPVIIVPPEFQPPNAISRVLIAMKGTARDARDLLRAIEVAAATDLELVVVHVDDEESMPSFSDQVQYESEAYAKEFLARYSPGAPEARLVLRIGVAVDEILAAADDVSPDLLAIGWPHPPDRIPGGVAREIVARSRVPVLLVAVTPRDS